MLSRDFNAAQLWFNAKRDLGNIVVPDWERFDLINRSISTVVGQFYDLLSQSYLTDAVINYSTGGKYDAGTGGTYIAATQVVTLNNPSSNLTNTDLEKLVVFRIGTTNYLGKVLSVLSTSTFKFDGDILPSVDGTIVDNSLSILDTTIQNDIISLSSLRIMRAGENIRIGLVSTATRTVKFMSQEELDTFTTDGRNSKTIGWSFFGDVINTKKGDVLASYGTITIHYPRVPYLVSDDLDQIDLPDGTAIEIATIHLRDLIRKRIELPPENNEALKQKLVGNLYQTFGQEASAEIIKEKALALK